MDLHRVLGFFYSRLNWDYLTPSPAGECALPPLVRGGVGGGYTLACWRGCGGADTAVCTTATHLIPWLVTGIQDHVLLLIGVVPEEAELLVIISDFFYYYF